MLGTIAELPAAEHPAAPQGLPQNTILNRKLTAGQYALKICFFQRVSSAPVGAKLGSPTHPSPGEVAGRLLSHLASGSSFPAAPSTGGARAGSLERSMQLLPISYSRKVWQRFSLGVYRSHGERSQPWRDWHNSGMLQSGAGGSAVGLQMLSMSPHLEGRGTGQWWSTRWTAQGSCGLLWSSSALMVAPRQGPSPEVYCHPLASSSLRGHGCLCHMLGVWPLVSMPWPTLVIQSLDKKQGEI